MNAVWIPFFKFALPLAALLSCVALTWLNYVRHPWKNRPPSAFRYLFLAGLTLLVFVPTIHRERTELQQPEVRVLVDASVSMSLTDGLSSTRMERAANILSDIKDAYGHAFVISCWAFGSRIRAVSDPKTLKPQDSLSDLSAALKRMTSDLDPSRVRAIFLLTDGAHTSSSPPGLWARTSPTPIYVAGIGKTSYPFKDLAIESLEAPEIAFKDSIVGLTARIRSVGLEGKQRYPVSLSAGGRLLEEKGVELAGGTGTIKFSVKPDRAGLIQYRVSLPRVEGELSHRNNTRDVAVLVEEKPRELLLLSGQPSWETAFLRRVIAADPRFSLEARELKLKGQKFDFSSTDLAKHRLVILSRFASRSFKEGQIPSLLDFVQKNEGSLLILGTSPDDVEDLCGSELSRVLPVGKPEGRWETPRRMNLILSPQGLRHPVCTVLPHPQANLLAWKNLPPILPTAVFSIQQSGESLATTVLAGFPYYPRDLVAIAYRFAGRGLVTYFNTCETHLLKLLPASADDKDQVYQTFMSNLLDWMTDQSRGLGVALIVPKARYLQGETVDLGVNDYQGLLPPGDVVVSVVREGGERLASLKLARGEDGISGSFVPDAPGVHTLSVAVPGKGVIEKRLLVQEDSKELDRPFADLDLLKELGPQSGGAFFPEGDRSLSRVALDAAPIVQTIPSNVLWIDDGKLLALLLLLLCAEWISRRRRNMT